MGSLKLQSFEDFANASAEAAKMKLEEEQKAARTESAYQFETLLSEFGVTSVKDLNEEDRNKFFAKLGASEVSESLAVIEEGTRSQIGIISKRGKIESVYMHYDGYPDHMLPTIKKGYMNSGTVKYLLKKGGGSGLEPDASKINFYGDKTTLKGDAKKIEDYIRDASDRAGAEYVYLFDERDGKWYMADVYGDQELIPAFESLIINEAFKPSKGNARDAKKVSKFLNTFFMKHSAIANSDSFLGACRYLLAEALTDANFHSYRDPVSKALGGKIATIMVDIENLGGMSVPIGKKTLINLLDQHYTGVASAAGWSGIGIVEGMALFLDGFGYSQPAQKIVDAFELIWANESVVNEGNAFFAARSKAMEEGADEFEFNGKTFSLAKEEEEVEEEVVAEGDIAKVSKKEIMFHLDAFQKGDIEAEDLRQAIEEIIGENKTEEVTEEEVTEDEIEIKVDGDYEIEVEKEDDEEEGEESEEAPAEEEEAAEESVTNEAEVKSDEEFKEYAFSVLQQAFGDKFDEEKAKEVVDGLLGKHGEDYGAAVGALQSSLG